MTTTKKLRVIPKEKAVFWLDRYGRWHNEHGPFEHKRIIAYFNAAIQRDKDGYHLYQETEYGAEKVYFPYEDCVLFAVDLILDEPVTIILNTGRKIKLMPGEMSIHDNDLYMQAGEDRIKFIDRSLIKISKIMHFKKDQYHIQVDGKKYHIPNDESESGDS